jgi:hypothetical protein
MTDTQQFVAALSATVVPSFAVLVGILLNNARLNDFCADVNTRFDHVDKQFLMLSKLFDAPLERLRDRVADT